MPAPAMTYTTLVSDVTAYAERSDTNFTDQIPRFIMMCENRIASEVRGLGLMKFATSNFISGTANYAKPDRWRETVSMSYVTSGQRYYLFERSYEYCRTYWPVTATTTTTPKYYANYDYTNFLIVGTPGSTDQFELCYYERPLPLSASNETNWVTEYSPQLLLYGTLLEAQPFLKLDERMVLFKQLYQEAADGVANEAKRRAQDQSNVRTEA